MRLGFGETEMAKTIGQPCVVNKFSERADAEASAKEWSKDGEEFTVIYAADGEGLMYFVERGDGGMIRSSEMLIGHWQNGKKIVD